MSETKNECEIVNRISRKVEKELAENMNLVNEDIAEINEKLEDVALIDDTTASTTSTYSSEKIEDLISDIPTGAEIDDSTETITTTWSSTKIKTEIDAGGGGGSDVIDDTNISTSTTFSSDLIVDFVMNKDSYIKNVNGQFGRIETTFTTVTTIQLNDVLLSRGFEMLYTQQDGFSTDRSGIVTIQLVGNTTGTTYIEKSYTGYDLIPEGNTHINISDDFMFDAGDIDSSDTSLIYKINASNGPWSTSFPYTFKLMAVPFNTYDR